eukprot:scaffold14086_cov48-Cyclotella_meneghiniana.AAC.1
MVNTFLLSHVSTGHDERGKKKEGKSPRPRRSAMGKGAEHADYVADSLNPTPTPTATSAADHEGSTSGNRLKKGIPDGGTSELQLQFIDMMKTYK